MDLFNSDSLSNKRSFENMLEPDEFSIDLGNADDFFDSMGCDEADMSEVALPILERPQIDADNHQVQQQVQQEVMANSNTSSNSPDYRALLVEARDEMAAMSDTIRRLKTRLASLQHKQARHCAPSCPNAQQVQASPALSLRVNGSIETVWYADRDLPHFTMEVVNPATNTTCVDLAGMKIEVTLRDGKGKDATDKLVASRNSSSSSLSSTSSSSLASSSSASSSSSSSSGAGLPLSFPVTGGTACVSGLRFTTVSSKCGGHFRLEFALVPSIPSSSLPLATLASAPVQVLSYRLYHCRKLSAEKLTPADSVAKMKGIGALYAKRLAAINIHTVQALALLDVGIGGEGAGVVAFLRRDRGGLTAAKLAEYVNQAREIVARHEADISKNYSNQRPAKRARVAPTQPLVVAMGNVCGVPSSPEANEKHMTMLGLQQQQQHLQQQQQQQHVVVPNPAMCAAALVQAYNSPAMLGL